MLDDLAGADRRTRAARLAVGFTALLALTVGLIVLGALVRAHGAGLACPDWPLCFGRLVPEMDLQVAFEYSHRVLAGSVALCFAGLAWATVRDPLARTAAGRWVALGAILLGVQILLGALTVWKLLASWSVTSHLLTGNAFALTLLMIACRLRETASGDRRRRPAAPPSLRAALAVSALLLGLQLLLGGQVSSRYAGLACPQWPTCEGGVWFPAWSGSVGLHLLHRLNGYSLLAALAASAWLARGHGGALRRAAAALAIAAAQVGVGVANVLTGLPVELTGLHSALATALALALALALRSAWSPARRDAGAA